MSKAKAAAQSKAVGASKAQALELQKRVDELTEALEILKNENELIKEKFKKLCKKLVENIDISQYEFIDSSTEPDQIDIRDLLNMLQRLALMATQISATDNIETHMEALELRISELTNENSSFFKNKLKLQERLEFIMQERDVWKRNAETLKRMYAKLGTY
jgi:chaperonin cofactor prefoldin